jgi:hypothetical protein
VLERGAGKDEPVESRYRQAGWLAPVDEGDVAN